MISMVAEGSGFECQKIQPNTSLPLESIPPHSWPVVTDVGGHIGALDLAKVVKGIYITYIANPHKSMDDAR